MTAEEFHALDRGDVVRNKKSNNTYAVLNRAPTEAAKLKPVFATQSGEWFDATGALGGRARNKSRWMMLSTADLWDVLVKNGAPNI